MVGTVTTQKVFVDTYTRYQLPYIPFTKKNVIYFDVKIVAYYLMI